MTFMSLDGWKPENLERIHAGTLRTWRLAAGQGIKPTTFWLWSDNATTSPPYKEQPVCIFNRKPINHSSKAVRSWFGCCYKKHKPHNRHSTRTDIMYETFPHPPPPHLFHAEWKSKLFSAGCEDREDILLVTKRISLCILHKKEQTLPNAVCLLHIPLLVPRVIFAWRAGETFVAPTCSDCRQKSSYTLADLACGAACLSDTPVPCYDDSSAFCPLWAFVTVYSLWWTETWWNGHGAVPAGGFSFCLNPGMLL